MTFSEAVIGFFKRFVHLSSVGGYKNQSGWLLNEGGFDVRLKFFGCQEKRKAGSNE